MIINTGQRTDIPAFYSEWFANRLREGFVLVRNPYNTISVTKYILDPSVVDIISFCSKNPWPMLKYKELLKPFRQFWFVTITPYGKEIEPNVPDVFSVVRVFQELSGIVGPDAMCWRYDPIFLSNEWTVEKHLLWFENIAKALENYTHSVVISFIDLYEKVKKNFPEISAVPVSTQLEITKALVETGKKYDMVIKPCAEDRILERTGADCSGCSTIEVYEKAFDINLNVPSFAPARNGCSCYLSADIGAYNTCGHLCKYCYANADVSTVNENMKQHDPKSPLLVGHISKNDNVREAKQESWIDHQMRLIFA